MAAVSEEAAGGAPTVGLPEAFRPRTGTMDSWNAAYVRVEDYLRAHRIHNRLHQSRLIQKILERAARRHAAHPALDPTMVAAEETEALMDNWFSEVLDEKGQPIGAASIAPLVRARGSELALSVAQTQLAHVHPQWDLHRIARKMSDFNLTVLPVLDAEHETMIGVITVDDLLEELLPQGWRREFGMSAVEE